MSPAHQAADQLTWSNFTEHFQLGHCADSGNNCLQVNVSFPLAQDKDHKSSSLINASIKHQVLHLFPFQPDQQDDSLLEHKSLHELMHLQAEKIFANMQHVFHPVRGFISIQGKAVQHVPDCWTVELRSFQYTGGAHPSHYYAILNFDSHTGKCMHWSAFVQDSVKAKQIAKQIFMQQYHLEGKVNWEQTGMLIPADAFYLPDNFIPYPDSLVFMYNEYEILPYVYGLQNLCLPLDSLRNRSEKK